MKAICAATRGLPLSQFLKCVVSVFLEFQPQCSLSKSTFTTLCWNLSTQDFFFLDYGVICSWWESCPYMCCEATLGVILPSEKPADSELMKKKSYATYYIWHQRKETMSNNVQYDLLSVSDTWFFQVGPNNTRWQSPKLSKHWVIFLYAVMFILLGSFVNVRVNHWLH